MTRMMDIFEHYLEEKKYEYVRLDGDVKLYDRGVE